jgi:hypothetical protein
MLTEEVKAGPPGLCTLSHARLQHEGAILEAQSNTDITPAGTSILDFQPPELGAVHFCSLGIAQAVVFCFGSTQSTFVPCSVLAAAQGSLQKWTALPHLLCRLNAVPFVITNKSQLGDSTPSVEMCSVRQSVAALPRWISEPFMKGSGEDKCCLHTREHIWIETQTHANKLHLDFLENSFSSLPINCQRGEICYPRRL